MNIYFGDNESREERDARLEMERRHYEMARWAQDEEERVARARTLVAFLESIGGDGYGGTSEYEVALQNARDLIPANQ